MVITLVIYLENVCEKNGANCDDEGTHHPQDERVSTKKIEQLRQVVGWLSDGAKRRDQSRTKAGEYRPHQRESRELFFQEHGRKGGIEDKTRGL